MDPVSFWSTPVGWTLLTVGQVLLITVVVLVFVAFLLLADRPDAPARARSDRSRALFISARPQFPQTPTKAPRKKKGRQGQCPPPPFSSCRSRQLALAATPPFTRRLRSSSATRKASSSDWLAFRRGSQAV